jgi:hypothetical protein
VKIVNADAELFQVVAARRSASRLACGLDGWQQEGHEDANNGDDDEQLNKRKACASAPGGVEHGISGGKKKRGLVLALATAGPKLPHPRAKCNDKTTDKKFTALHVGSAQ